MSDIKFGTDGWRAIIAKEFTVDNVARVAIATGIWVKKNYPNPSIVVGHDCRFGGELFTDTVAKVFVSQGIKVFLAHDMVSTPMISMATLEKKASLGVVITASHNPPSYNGYKLKGDFGGPLNPDGVQAVEDCIPNTNNIDVDNINLEDAEKAGLLEYVDLETMYCERVERNFDLNLIKNSSLKLAYDAMYGSGQNVLKRLLPDITFLHCEQNPSFHGQAPEPIHKNLTEFSQLIKNSDIDCGLATDGDADRIGLYNSKGEFVDSHHIILLLLKYLRIYKKMSGKVVVAASTTPRVITLAKKYGLETEIVKIGFKYIAMLMQHEDVLIGGEESGGIAIKGHIPERDGIWMGLVIWEYMAKTGKSLEELVQEIYEVVGEFKYWRDDLHLSNELKETIITNCENNKYKSFGSFIVQSCDKTDGYKYFFENGAWLMIRPSGTEPVLRVYAEGCNLAEAQKILSESKKTILNN